MTKSPSDRIAISAEKFYRELNDTPHGRYRSWGYCYKAFHDARKVADVDYDYLSLQLAFYLASWGMYRGSSFLLQKDYKIHLPVIKELLNSKYDPLFGIRCNDLRKNENKDLLNKLNIKLQDYYETVRRAVKEEDIKQKVSDTLITKVLMGTLGCVPAYDRYFVAGVKALHIATGNYNLDSLLKLVDFYEENEQVLEKARSKMKVLGLGYPQMKVLDMGLWQIGLEEARKR